MFEEAIASDDEKWKEAAELGEKGASGLTFVQFLGFLHPELSDAMLGNMAQVGCYHNNLKLDR